MPSRSFLLTLCAALVVGYLGLNLLVRWIYPKQLFPYRGSSYQESEAISTVRLDDGTEIAFYYLAADDPDAPLLFYFHGNGEDIGHNEERFAWIRSAGYSVLALDYPGYGLSTGKPTAESVRAATDAVWKYAQNELGAQAASTVLWGRSLGGSPAIYLAAQENFRGVLLESAFRSVLSLAPPIPWLFSEPFPNETLIKQVSAPVALFHGELDRVIPVSHSKTLKESAGGETELFLFPEGTHNNLRHVGGEEMLSVLQRLR